MIIYKALRVGLVVLITVVSTGVFADSQEKEVFAIGIHMYTQPSRESQRTDLQVSPHDMTVVTLSPAWMKVKNQRALPIWVKRSSVEELANDQVYVGHRNVAAFLSIPDSRIEKPASSARLPSDTVFSVDKEVGSWLRIEAALDVELWVNSQDYLVATSSRTKLEEKNVNISVSRVPSYKAELYLNWLCAQPPSKKTLQLASFREVTAVDGFLSRHPQLKDNNLRRARSLDQSWHYLLYGSYNDDQEAESQIRDLDLLNESVSIRSFDYLQSKRCSANDLVAQ